MIDINKYHPTKPQCEHKNDADNCLLCGTKQLVSAPYGKQAAHTVTPPNPRAVEWTSFLKCVHGSPLYDCWFCDLVSEVPAKRELERQAEVDRINAVNIPLFEAAERAEKLKEAEKHAAIALGSRCWHDKPALDCDVCRLAEADYDRDVYRTQINKALKELRYKHGRTNVREAGGTVLFDERAFSNDHEGLDDLVALVDVEILKATRHYGAKMSEALAYTVARNTIKKFQQRVVEEVSVLVDIEWAAMSPSLHERALALFKEAGTVEGLEILSRDDRADKDRRDLARQIVVEYGIRRSRYLSFDEPNVDDSGEAQDVSVVEQAIHEAQRIAEERVPDLDGALSEQLIEEYHPELEALVRQWRGTQRKVGEAILAGTFTGTVQGVSRATAYRVRSVVLAAFRTHLGSVRIMIKGKDLTG